MLDEGIVWACGDRAMKQGDVLCSICGEPMTPKTGEADEAEQPVCYLCTLRKKASKPIDPSG